MSSHEPNPGDSGVGNVSTSSSVPIVGELEKEYQRLPLVPTWATAGYIAWGTAIIGMLGTLALGVGLSHYFGSSIPNAKAVQLLAQACIKNKDSCDLLSLADTTRFPIAFIVLGIACVAVHCFLLYFNLQRSSAPSKETNQPPRSPPEPG